MEENKETKDVVDAEYTEKKSEAKKESSFKQFFKKAKASLDQSMLEDKIKSAYRKDHGEFDYYSYGENTLFGGNCVFGSLEGDVLTYFGTSPIPPYSVLIDCKTEKAYYVTEEGSDTTVSAIVEGVTYERAGKRIRLDPNVEEVKVVKAGKRYFLYKGKEK